MRHTNVEYAKFKLAYLVALGYAIWRTHPMYALQSALRQECWQSLPEAEETR